MEVSRVCYESASAEAAEARRRRIDAWSAEMRGLGPDAAHDLAKQLDQTVELDPYLAENESAAVFETAAPHIRALEIKTLDDLPGRLPVFPAAAQDAMSLAWEPECTLSALERIGKGDPVLAGAVVSAANSALFGARQPITELRRAVAYMGTDVTRNVLLAAAMRPFFGNSRFRPLWVHSLETAQAGDRLSHVTGDHPVAKITTGEAFLTGLVHDIGRLAFLLSPIEITNQVERLTAAGCPLAAVERALFGADHAEFGALILEKWKFDQRVVEGVRYHHRPERSGGIHAALMYLAEFRGDSEEDLPSLARLKHCCMSLNVEMSTVTGIAFDLTQTFVALRQ